MPKHTKLIADFTEGSNKPISAFADFDIDLNEENGIPGDLKINLLLEDGREVSVGLSYLHFQSTINVLGTDLKVKVGQLQAAARARQQEAIAKQNKSQSDQAGNAQ